MRVSRLFAVRYPEGNERCRAWLVWPWPIAAHAGSLTAVPGEQDECRSRAARR